MSIEFRESNEAILVFEGNFSLYGVGCVECESQVVNCGSGIIASVKSDRAQTLINSFKGKIYGYSVEVSEKLNINYILSLLKADIVKCEKVCGREIYYCYSACKSEYVISEGNKVNYQIAISEDKVVIGTPLILGSY